MEGYLLYRKEDKTSIVLTCEDDDELHYLLRKLERSRVKWLKVFAKELLTDFFEKSNGVEPCPPVRTVRSNKAQN
jgi:hypothetical protein